MENLLIYIGFRNAEAEVFGHKKLDPHNLTVADRLQLRKALETDLSPENLTCDGELSGFALAAKSAHLRAAMKELLALGA